MEFPRKRNTSSTGGALERRRNSGKAQAAVHAGIYSKVTPILATKSRADRAFERMYDRHVGDVYRYALAVLRNQADAEDVTQTTFMNAYRAFQRGERPEKAQNWLIRIAHNVCRQRFRQASRRPNEVAFDENLAEAPPVANEGPTAEDLTRALGQLAFNQRSALVLRELEGRSYAEIAGALGLSVSAVETLLFRARRALREQLEGTLTCNEAELAISKQADGQLGRSDRGALRAHLRQCKECATFARSQRAQRAAWKGLAAIPLPSSLASFFGGGGGAAVGTGAATAGVGVAVKAAMVAVATALAGGVGYEGVKHHPWRSDEPRVAVRQASQAPSQPPAAPPTFAIALRPAARPPAKAAPPKATPATSAKPKPKKKQATKARPAKRVKATPGQAKKVTPAPAPAPAVPAPRPVEPPADLPSDPGRGKAVGLARSERAARDRTKPKHEPVGLARSEQRSKAKSKAKAKLAPAAPEPPAPQAAKVKHKKAEPDPQTAPAPSQGGGGKK